MSAAPVASARASNGGVGQTPSIWIVVGVVAALVVGVVLRFVAASELWLDEALTVNIAQVPWGDLEPTLRRDGAPPLFYALLHLWIDLFGDSNLAVRALPGVISAATLPFAYFAGRRIGGARLGWITLVLLVASPYAIRYATEARMYSLQVLLVFAGYLALVRALERPDLSRLAPVALVTAALLYNQYWSPYLVAVVALGLLVTALRGPSPSRAGAGRAFVAMVLGGLAFVPWLPTLRHQLEHTGTPWGEVYLPPAGFGLTAIEFAGARFAFGWLLAAFVVVLPLLGLFGRALDRRHIELDLRTVEPTRWVAAAGAGALALGLSVSYLTSNTYEGRYGSVVFPLFILVAARGIGVFSDSRVRVGLLAVIVALGLGVGAQHGLERRTEADDAAAAVLDGAQPGDVVIYCPDQLGPGVARLLGDADLVQLTFPDGDRPEFVDWTDYATRHAESDPAGFVAEVLEMAGDRVIWLVSATGYQHADAPCGAVDLNLTQARPAAQRVVLEDTDVFEHHSVTRFEP